MTKKQSELNNVNLSLDQFLGTTWKSKKNLKANPEALEMLLVKTNAMPEINALKNEKKQFPDTKLVHIPKTKSSKNDQQLALQEAIDDKNYLHIVKLTYPKLWYVVELTIERIWDTIKWYPPKVYILSCRIWSNFWIIILAPFEQILDVLTPPVEYFLYLFCETAYRNGKIAVKQGYHATRFWIGRGRGDTYIKAMYHRLRYIIAYFQIHKFYNLDQFIRSSFTIRRSLQAILPLSITYLIVQRTISTPQVVYSKGLEKTSKTFTAVMQGTGEKLWNLYEMGGGIESNEAYFRNSQGLLFTRFNDFTVEFVEGKYTDVEKTIFENFIHPNEFLSVLPHVNAKELYITPSGYNSNIGCYEWSSEEELAQMPPRTKEEEEDDEMEPPPFTPEPGYKLLKQKDTNLLKRTILKSYKKVKSSKIKKVQFVGRQKEIVDLYVPLKPRHGQFPENEHFYDKDYKEICKMIKTEQVPSVNSVKYNQPWEAEISTLDSIQSQIFKPTNLNSILNINETNRNSRVTFSPFGITYQTAQNTSLPLKPFSRQETKLFHYGFTSNQKTLEALGVRPYRFHKYETVPYIDLIQTRTNQGLKSIDETKVLFKEQEEIEFDFNFENDEDEDNEFETLNFTENEDAELEADEDEFGDDELEDEDKLEDEEDDELEDVKTITEENDDESGFTGVEKNEITTESEDSNNSEVKEHQMSDESKTITRYLDKDFLLTAKDFTGNNDPSTTLPLWFSEGTLFLNPYQYDAWRDLALKGIVLQLLMYAGIELCVRIECRGVVVRNAPIVNSFIAHIDRMPEAVRLSEYIGEKMKTPPVKKLILAFQAQRGMELYGYSSWLKLWNQTIRPNLSSEQETKFLLKVEKLKANLEEIFVVKEEKIKNFTPQQRKILEVTSLKGSTSKDILPRYTCFNKFTEIAKTYLNTMTEHGDPMNPSVLKERQELFNRFGGESALMKALEYGETVQDEIRQLPLFSLIKPGTERMRQLPKGMILLGEPGNGRTYFVRTLATASRLPLLITESNRYLNEMVGLVRLKALFRRAREQAPNILFIRDLDFMTRHRERYPMFASVRATTQLLLAMDGYSKGTETIASQQDIFVMGSMTTTSMMDDACMRSGRFEWVLDFYYPPVNERHQMLLLHSQKSMVNNPNDIDWRYFSAMTEGFSCLDLRILVNTSAVYIMKQGFTNMHTKESMAFALGSINQVHDLPQTQFVDPSSTLGFFPTFAFSVRRNQPTQYAPFFTQTGEIPMYKKLMHVFRNMVPQETEILKNRWNTTSDVLAIELFRTLPTGVIDGLLSLLCEGLFIYNTQKAIGEPYPVVTFETYCCPLFFTAKEGIDMVTSQHTLERVTKEHTFVTSFDLWRRTQTPTSYPMAITSVKSLDMRAHATALLRTQRFSKEHSLIGGLNEVQYEILFGAPSISDKIKHRLAFLTKKQNEFASRDANIFGTFETTNDLSFKCKKDTTARRIDQVAMEIVDLMHKNWRSKGTQT